ncbi:MAG TPA: DNA-binding protein [Candidatus Competibacteraceae bacterium]|nr:DNA-binding protein [Candidatus Competibacteraceae bacterium]
MARSGIRYEEVKEVAKNLLSRGLNPTIQRVREVLGTGSNTTISEHLKRWQQQMANAPRAVLPPVIPETVTTAMETFWNIAVVSAETAFEEQRNRALQAVVTAEQARDAALAESRQAQAEAAETHRQWEVAQAAQRDLAERLLVEQERRTTAETAIQAAEKRVQAATASIAEMRAETDSRIAQMNATLLQLRNDLDQQRQEAEQRLEYERQRGEANEARIMQLLDRERVERTAEQQAFTMERQNRLQHEATLMRQLESIQRERSELQHHLTNAQERLEQSTAALETLNVTLGQCEEQVQETGHALEIMRVRLETEVDLRQRLEQEATEMRKLLKEIMTRLDNKP